MADESKVTATTDATVETEETTEETTAEETTDATEETTTEEAEEEFEPLSESELKESKHLYKLLKDKTTGPQVLRVLAQRAGLFNDLETKKDVKEGVKDLKTIVSEKLGPEYAFLTDKLSGVLEAVLETERQQQRESISHLQESQVETETNNALEKLANETKGLSRKLESKMISLMDEVLPAKGISTYQYLKRLYEIASSGAANAKASSIMVDKIKKNSKDVASRLHSSSGGTGTAGNEARPAKKGIDAAVRFAMEQLEKGNK